MTYHAGMGQYTDQWTQTKAAAMQRSLARRGVGAFDSTRTSASRGYKYSPPVRAVAIPAISQATRGYKYSMGQAPASPEPPPVGQFSTAMFIGWGAAVFVAAGIMWAASRGMGTKAVRSNRRRMSRNKLSRSQRARIPVSSFALPGRRFPVNTPGRARTALAYLKMGRVANKSDFDAVRAAVRTRYPGVYFRYAKGLSWERTKQAKRRATSHRRMSRRMAANTRRSRRLRRNLFGGSSKRKIKSEGSGGVWVEEAPGKGAFVLFRHAKPSAAAPWCIVDEAGKVLACETTEAKARESSRSLYGTSVERR